MATALGALPQSAVDPVAAIVEVVSMRRMLLVLDNCEHVVETVAAVAAALLKASGPTIVATAADHSASQANRYGQSGPGSSGRSPLFDVRARAANRDDAAERIRTPLPSLRPARRAALAIELAAARARSLTPTEIASRLDRSLEFLHTQDSERRRDTSPCEPRSSGR